jgi:hypothetical protein
VTEVNEPAPVLPHFGKVCTSAFPAKKPAIYGGANSGGFDHEPERVKKISPVGSKLWA